MRRSQRLMMALLLVAALVGAVGMPAAAATEFHGAWPYVVPPAGHYNTYVTNNLMNNGMYWDLVEQPMAMYNWHDGSWMPLLATGWKITPPNKFTVTLRKGVKWQDGTPFTAQDVLTTFYVGRVMNWVVWRYVDKIEATDDFTVTFHMAKPSSVVPRYVLRERIRSNAVYGTYGKKAQALSAQGKAIDSDEMKNLRLEFEQFRPQKLIGSGPYALDTSSITEAQYTLVKHAGAWNRNKVGFDKIIVFNGETPTITPLVLAKQIDYATHGFPPATERRIVAEKIDVIRPPLYTGPAIFLNHDVYPLNRKEVRQAIAYALDRDQNATVSLGKSAIRQKFMAGFSDNLVPLWLSAAERAKLEGYEFNVAKAEQLLKGIGFKKDRDGVWLTDKGNRMEYELTVPAEYADWSASAENAAEQLTRLGIKTTVRGVTFTQQPIEVQQGRFQMAIQAWGIGNPHPNFSFVQNLFTYNYVGGAGPGSVQSGAGPGINFPLQQTTSAGKIDLEAAVVASAQGLAEADQKAAVARLALAFNELLPIIPLWERYGNNPALDGVRVKGWPPETDPRYRNSPYADSFVAMMILDGTLQPK